VGGRGGGGLWLIGAATLVLDLESQSFAKGTTSDAYASSLRNQLLSFL
jgi:hypothetical protein